MIWFLRIVFLLVLLVMLAVTGWAGIQCAVWRVPRTVVLHPWFIATLFDTYFAFLTFYFWVVYQEASVLRAIAWFFLIMLLGNIAMASYMLIRLFRLPASATLEDVLLRRKT
jgi:predicted permease